MVNSKPKSIPMCEHTFLPRILSATKSDVSANNSDLKGFLNTEIGRGRFRAFGSGLVSTSLSSLEMNPVLSLSTSNILANASVTAFLATNFN